MTKQLVIESLNKYHHRIAFQCGEIALDDYLNKYAQQDVKRRISRVFIAREPDNSSKILGYYTLSTVSIVLSHLPEAIAKKLPKHPIPAALIGRLAVCKSSQGQAIGTMLLVDAIKRTLGISSEIGIYAMVVDAINEDACGFYTQFGFKPLINNNSRLFLPLKSFL